MPDGASTCTLNGACSNRVRNSADGNSATSPTAPDCWLSGRPSLGTNRVPIVTARRRPLRRGYAAGEWHGRRKSSSLTHGRWSAARRRSLSFRGKFGRAEWQPDGKQGAVVLLAFRQHGAAVLLDDLPHPGQADPGADDAVPDVRAAPVPL